MHTKRRRCAPLIMLFGVIIAVLAFAVPANAAPYTTQPTVAVSSQTVTAGGSITFSGSGFLPGETVRITVSDPITLKSVVADSSGSFSTVIVLPAGLTGAQTLTATGLTSGRTASITIQVLAASANPFPTSTATGGLAFTGAAVGAIGALGGLLLIGGGLMMLASRRRKVND
jgi:hypothetical protein